MSVLGFLKTAFGPNSFVRVSDIEPLPTGLATLIAGEDQSRNAIRTISGAQQYGVIRPLPSAAAASSTMPLSNVIAGGGVGAAGDLLSTFNINVGSNTNAAVYIQDGSIAAIAGGTTATSPTNTTTLAATASAPQTWTANQYAGNLVSVTYIPTGGAVTTVIRKIVSHALVSASTAISVVVTHAIPAGASVTAWSLLPLSAWEVLPFNAPIGFYPITYGRASVNGGWKISVDLGAQVEYSGIFS